MNHLRLLKFTVLTVVGVTSFLFFRDEEKKKQKQKVYTQPRPKVPKQEKDKKDDEEEAKEDVDSKNNETVEIHSCDGETIGIDLGTSNSYVGVWENDNVTILGNDKCRNTGNSIQVLRKMKGMADAHLGKEVRNAVITVPSHFKYSRRQAIRDAGSAAGLNVLSIMNESTAAALAYCRSKVENIEEEENVLIFDLGSESLVVSLVSIADNIVEVEATKRDDEMGGNIFDDILEGYVLADIEDLHRGKSLDKGTRLRVKAECERAKRRLSSCEQTDVAINDLFEGVGYNRTITRARFEDLCKEKFRKCMETVEDILDEAGFSKDSIHEVVLVGASTRIPKIQSMLSDIFNEKKIWKSLNPEEAVVNGATVQAAILSGKDTISDKLPIIRFFDLSPHSLGVETAGGVMTTMIKQNEMIPFKKTMTFTTNYDDQTKVHIKVYEGDHSMTRYNSYIGELILDGIPPMSVGKPQIEVCYDVECDGILTVTAFEKRNGMNKQLTFNTKSAVDNKPTSSTYGDIAIYGFTTED